MIVFVSSSVRGIISFTYIAVPSFLSFERMIAPAKGYVPSSSRLFPVCVIRLIPVFFMKSTLQKIESPAQNRYQMLFAVNSVPEASSIEVSAFQNSAFTLTACHLRNDVRSEIID